jgi:hypothetical protein
LLISALSWSRGSAGRAAYGFLIMAYRSRLPEGGAFLEDETYFGHPSPAFAADPLYKGFDTLSMSFRLPKARYESTRTTAKLRRPRSAQSGSPVSRISWTAITGAARRHVPRS